MAMSLEVQHLIACLAKVVGWTPPHNPDVQNLHWDRWIELALHHQIAPLLGSRLKRLDDLPDAIRQELVLAHVREGRESLPRLARLRELLGVVRREGADVAVLKGVAVMARLYEEAAERMMFDADLLLRDVESAQKFRHALVPLGWASGRVLSGHHHLPVLRDVRHSLAVELHVNLHTPPLPGGLIEELWERRELCEVWDGYAFKTLDPVGMLFHHALHALADPIDAPFLRNIFEVGWLAASLDEKQRAAFTDIATRYHLASHLARALWLARDFFGTPAWIPRPMPSAIEFWCVTRLEWYDATSLADRLERNLARRHFDALVTGVSPHNPFVPLAIACELAARPVSDRIQKLFRKRGALQAAPGTALDLGAASIVQVLRTGEVHLLSGPAAQAWREVGAGGQPAATDVVRILESKHILVRHGTAGYPERS